MSRSILVSLYKSLSLVIHERGIRQLGKNERLKSSILPKRFPCHSAPVFSANQVLIVVDIQVFLQQLKI